MTIKHSKSRNYT